MTKPLKHLNNNCGSKKILAKFLDRMEAENLADFSNLK